MKTSNIILLGGLALGAYYLYSNGYLGSATTSTSTGTSSSTAGATDSTASKTSANTNSTKPTTTGQWKDQLTSKYGKGNLISTSNPLEVKVKSGGEWHRVATGGSTGTSEERYAARVSNISDLISRGAYSEAKAKELKEKYNL